MKERIVDVNGSLVNYPKYYHTALEAAWNMIDELEARNVDVSDMHVALNTLLSDIKYHLTLLRKRDGGK